jgi:hypothetical protein
MNDLEYLDKIISNYDFENSHLGISVPSLIQPHIDYSFDLSSRPDYNLSNRIADLITKFDYGERVGKQPPTFIPKTSWEKAKELGGHFKYQEYLKEEEHQERIYKETDRELKWYDKENARIIFEDYPNVNARSKWALAISIILLIVELIKWLK